jgi:outer membrane lipoprotein-sorting protein
MPIRLLVFIIPLILFVAHPAFAQDAAEIVKKADVKMRGKTLIADVTIKTVRPDWEREMGVKTWMKGSEFSMILITSPSKDEGTSFLKRGKEVWNWIPSVERTIKLPPSMMSQSWMGTDFTNDDLVKEASIIDDYTHTIIGEENIGGRNCYRIGLIPKPASAVVWGKVNLWIDKTDFLELKSEFFDEDGVLINVMTASNVRNMGGREIPTYFEMIPADKPEHKTVLIYNDVVFDSPISDDFFTSRNMKELK